MLATTVKTRNKAKRCGLYVHVSLERQVDRNSLATQEAQLREYVGRRTWAVAEVFLEAGLSGKNTERPAFQEMVKWAKGGKLDVIVVSKIDRISRNLIDLLTLIENLKKWGVDFVSASQAFDTSTPMGTLILNILGSFAQFEREMIADRVRENMLERAKKGIWSGGKPPFGYKVSPETKVLEIEPAEARVVRTVFSDFLRHKSVRRTCHAMNAAGKRSRSGQPWGPTTIRRILTNPTYVGTLCYGKRITRGNSLLNRRREDWIIVENAHEAIVERSDFEAAEAVLSANSKPRSWSESSPHLLSGLGRCGVCSSRIIGMTMREKGTGRIQWRYYRCLGRIQKGKSYCEGLSYRCEELEEVILGHITGFDANTLRDEVKRYQRQAARERGPLVQRKRDLSAEFERFSEKERRLLELYEDDLIDIEMFKERKRQLERQKLAIAAELTETESRIPDDRLARVDSKGLVAKFSRLQETFASLSLLEQRRLLQAMISEFTAYPDGRIEMDLNMLSGLTSSDIPLNCYRHIELKHKLGSAI
jgi:site-specific DNA recombinase